MHMFPQRPAIPGGRSSASSSTAAQALEQMAQIQKRIARGDTDAAQFLIEKASVSQQPDGQSSVESLRKSMREAKARNAASESAGFSKQTWLVGAAAALVCLAVAILAATGLGSAGHSVAGRIFVDEQSAGDLELVFHSLSRSDVRVKIKTELDGSFVVESLPAGDYKIILLPQNASHAIPKHYSSPISTPLRLKLHEDTSDLMMNVASERNTRQG
jgi:hypothetical protein